MEPPYHPQPHNDEDNVLAATSSFDSAETTETFDSSKPKISPRAQRRISPWAMDLQLKRGTTTTAPATTSKTLRSTSSWKLRMQQRKMVYGGVAVAEEEQEEEPSGLPEEEEDGPTPQQKALMYIKEQRKQRLEAREQQLQQRPPPSQDIPKENSILEEGNEEEEDEEDEEEEEDVEETKQQDTPIVASIEVLRQKVMEELKQVLGELSHVYIRNQYIVESVSERDPTEQELRRQPKPPSVEEGQKQIVMRDLKQRVSGIYTKDHHVVEAMSRLEQIINKEEYQEKTPLPLQPTLTTLKPLPMKDLPRANFHQFSASAAEEDEISVYTEATIEEMVTSSNATGDSNTKNAFKDQMRKSFLAFEQLVHAKHQIDNHNEEYDEETVFEEYSIVHDDSKTVMTEMTTEELIEQVVVKSVATKQEAVTQEEESKDTLENFQSEIRKSFAAFEALLGSGEFDEQQDDGETCDESFDEFTVDETINGPQQSQYDEVTVAESIIAELAGVVVEQVEKPKQTEKADTSKEQRKEAKILQFQNEMKKSFTAFESLLLKQAEKDNDTDDDDDDDDVDSTDEYTVEEIVDQVTAGEDSKLFAKEMQKSFLAFESLLKKTNQEESEWEEETVQETVQGSIAAASSNTPVTPKIAAYNPTAAAIPQSPNRSVTSEHSGKTYEDAISLVDDGVSKSGTQYDDAIPVLDAEEEEATKSRMYEDGEEKKDADSHQRGTSFDNTETTELETLSGARRLENAEKKEGGQANELPRSLPSSPSKRTSTGPVLILSKPDPKTPSPTKKFTPHRREASMDNALTNSRMFSDSGLVLSENSKKSKVKTPQKKDLPVMDVEFSDGDYEDDDDMTQITFDNTFQETPQKQRPNFRDDEGSAGGHDETGSTCSSQASKGIAEMLRRDIWSPDLLVVQSALEKLGMEAVKGTSYRSNIVKFGGLLGILRAMDMNPTHSGIQLAACQALERLALDPETQMSIGGVGGIPVVATTMKNNASNVEIQQAATAALVNISCCPQDNIEGCLEAVIWSMTKHANDTEVQENSFKVLANLTMDSPVRLKELSNRGGLAAMTMALQKPWSIKAEHHEAISLLSMLLRNLAECSQ